MGRRAIPYLLLCLVISSCSEQAQPHTPGELSIAAASSLRPAIDAMVGEWNRTEPAVPARVIYGESGALFNQISSSAPFDLFLSTDDVYARRLYRSGLADEPFEYATGTIVVWVPAGSEPPASLDELSDSRFEKIAVATPNLAPYGEAALESLEHLGIYDELKNRLLFATNTSEAADFATSGAANAAFLPLSLVIATDLDERGTHLVISTDLYDPI
ncbi:MAG: molybdate ABC transporter substrate-binding protein, partial [Acidobacteria bacterium]|nr:molybdate ABC transporter substrate-binding protein [Acidobacteriota bacterium]